PLSSCAVNLGRQRLRKLADDLRSEAQGALGQVTQHRGRYRADLGDLVPAAERAVPLGERLTAIEEARTAAQALGEVLRHLESIAVNDIVEYLEAINDELQHRLPKLPQLGTVYSRLRTVFEMRTAGIVEGLARAKKSGKKGDPGES